MTDMAHLRTQAEMDENIMQTDGGTKLKLI